MGLPVLSKSCQATDPPLDQPVPSVQTISTCPFTFAATAGCFRLSLSPGAAMGAVTLSETGSTESKQTWPAVSQAASTRLPPSLRYAVLIGQAFSFQGPTVVS